MWKRGQVKNPCPAQSPPLILGLRAKVKSLAVATKPYRIRPLSSLTLMSYSLNSAPATGFRAAPPNCRPPAPQGLGSFCPSVWNVLLPDVHTVCSLTCFKALPKGELLSTASNCTITPLSPFVCLFSPSSFPTTRNSVSELNSLSCLSPSPWCKSHGLQPSPTICPRYSHSSVSMNKTIFYSHFT